MGEFSNGMAAFVEQASNGLDDLCRATMLSLATKIILRSPVGNPELWKANRPQVKLRYEHNIVVDQITANLKSDPKNLTAKGNLKRSVQSKANRRLSKAELEKEYALVTGKGYVGGRFRGNWQVTVGSPATDAIDRIDKSGNEAIAAAAGAVAGYKAGPAMYIVNNLPYALPLEYGHSTQAPEGMVRISAAEFGSIVEGVAGAIAR